MRNRSSGSKLGCSGRAGVRSSLEMSACQNFFGIGGVITRAGSSDLPLHLSASVCLVAAEGDHLFVQDWVSYPSIGAQSFISGEGTCQNARFSIDYVPALY
ncbi:hypothetical protein C2845_PM08G02040 [Panicum miliaceum]|uniref:Uncharacterized protein n=1 Tax=Panicum miliaceum TaxID=4540 RepID=A0A3L6QYI1_PANMI|nr:hypothetical protein C2845_PM08G02040 [Panicum miliaceum]